MTDSPVKLNDYKIAHASVTELGLTETSIASHGQPPLKLTLIGQGFIISAMDPVIKIGDLRVTDFEIQSDQRGIVCYLYERPEEGAEISIDYGRGLEAKMPKLFSINKLDADGSVGHD